MPCRRCLRLISNVRPRGMLNTNTWRASGSEGKCLVKEPSAFALHRWANLARAVRPLAASAPAVHIEARAGRVVSNVQFVSSQQRAEASSSKPVFIEARAARFRKQVRQSSFKGSLLRRLFLLSAMRVRARQSNAARAATSFARGGGAVASASRVTQRTIHAGFRALRPRPNQSIKRTNNGGQRLGAFACTVPPLFAAYLQR